MNFTQQISNYILGNLGTSDLPKIGLLGINSGLYSESLMILAGLSDKDNQFEIDSYFSKALNELEIKLPDKKTAAFDLIDYYANLVKNKQLDPFLGIEKILNEILNNTDAFDKSNLYIYDSIGFEKIYSLYDTIIELKSSKGNWDNKKTNNELIEDLKIDLIIEIEKWLTNWERKSQ